MARHAFCVAACAGLALGAFGPLGAAPGDDLKTRIDNQLGVQKALADGEALLKKGDYQAAVQVLESKIAFIDGNHNYLTALAEAYRGHLRQLQLANREADAKTYRDRLAILDPEHRRPSGTPNPPAAPVPAPAGAPAAPTPMPPALAALASAGPTAATAVVGSPSAVVGRAKVEDDPFADANSVPAHRARALLDRAEREYDAKHFEAANQLYEQAQQQAPVVTGDCRARWAYCKLYVAVNAYRAGKASAGRLEREVQQALALAPDNEAFGKDLLRQVREHEASDAKVEVKHTPRQGAGWARAETANFRVFHNQSTGLAERVARTAEATRAAMARKWLGVALPAWAPRCDIYLHACASHYAKATGAPEGNDGHSKIDQDRDTGRVVGRRIDLRCDHPNMLDGVLPHETTHVVLAGQFGRHFVPHWADEGMAVLSEPRQRVDLHLRNLPAHRRAGHLFGLGQLMGMEKYPEARFVGPFYAQSVSLVEFFCRKKGPQAFTRFLRDGLEGGYEAALRKHYGIHGFAELEQQWREHAFGAGGVAATANKPATQGW
jgi:tetratricopeptide (TPR) repeat protein